MSNAAPGFEAHPNYEVKIEPSTARVRAVIGDTVVADEDADLRGGEDQVAVGAAAEGQVVPAAPGDQVGEGVVGTIVVHLVNGVEFYLR